VNRLEAIEKLFAPRSVAIVGASRTIGKWGFTFTLHLTHGRYKGEIYPVNPAGGTLLGHKVYKSIEDLPGPVDLAFILIPPDQVAEAVKACGRKGVPVAVVITAGFKEIGEAGRNMEREVVRAAEEAGVALVGPNCAGVTSPEPMNLYCMMQPTFPPAGGMAVVSQSGNLIGSIQHMLWKQDLGLSRSVSVGNQALLKVEDFLEYLITDDKTRVVTTYIESVSDGPRFMDVATRLSRVKPLLVIKGGQTESGVRAAKSHTGAIAGSGAVFEGLCRQCGAIVVDDVEDMLDTAVALMAQPLPRGNRVGIVANGGGWGVLTADACVRAGLDVVELPEETLKALDERLPAWWNRQNPVDMVAGISRGAFFKSMEILLKAEVIDSLIALGFGYGRGNTFAFAGLTEEDLPGVNDYVAGTLHSDTRGMNFVLDLIKNYQKPVLLSSEFVVGADRDVNEAVLELRKQNLLIYPSSRRTAQVLARMTRYGAWRMAQEG